VDAWPLFGLDDDLRPRMARVMAAGQPFALATVIAADGGPRGVGAQMVITAEESWGFVSGGCIEADVAVHGRAVLADGVARRLVYGRGSPWIDIRLPCGGSLELLVEPVAADDPALATLVAAYGGRRLVRYQSDGTARRCAEPEAPDGAAVIDCLFAPAQKLIVVGSDPIALAAASLGARLGWDATLVWPKGPASLPDLGVGYSREAPDAAITALGADPFTAIAVATHDIDEDERAIRAALATEAGYIGVLGARRRIPDRLARLRAGGVDEAGLTRLRMPIGLPIGAATPWEIAVSIASEIVANRRVA
jgi:xanthine dehydrogenase accessory factor